jgi:tight adherence protein B
MTTTLLALACTLGVVLAAMVMFPQFFGGTKRERTKAALAKLSEENANPAALDMSAALRSDSFSDNETVDAIMQKIPGMGDVMQMLRKSGLNINPLMYLMGLGIVFLLLKAFTGFMGLGIIGLIASVLGAWFIGKAFLKSRIEKREETFLNQFPDAVDMVVRSVRAGHPFSAAMHMIAENMEPPVSTEFKQVLDEVAYGRTMSDALNRMAERVNVPDVRFFVVVINVQQETGGNLGEVLSNLSGILRKRKQMRLKIKALTSEARMTAYILGALPLCVIGVLHLVSPDYLTPLFENQVGKFILGLALVMIGSAFAVVKKMAKIDI